MHDQLNFIVKEYGAWAIFLLMISNGFISAPPSELIIAIGGILIMTGKLSLGKVLLSVVCGNFVGAVILYVIGRLTGYMWLEKLVECLERVPLISKLNLTEKLSKDKMLIVENIFKRKGAYWLAVFRCVPVVRSIVSLPAGALGIEFGKFAFFSLVGMSIWAVAWIFIGYYISEIYFENGILFSLVLFCLLALVVTLFKRFVAKEMLKQLM